MKYHVRGSNETIVLIEKDFMGSGVDGAVYSYGSRACKIYHDKNKMIPDGKFLELKKIDRPNVIKPEEVLVDNSGIPIGFTMRSISGYQICELFSNGFRTDNNVTDSTINDIVKIIVETIPYIHKRGCLIVDGNELSYIVDKKFKDVFLIDVDSYGTPSYKYTAYHPNTRDVHSTVYTELTDWFGVAIILCWLYVGVHPYKGKHPKYSGRGVELLERRMKDNISIFNKEVAVNSNARDFNCIPCNYKGWFVDLFEKGMRCPPPGLPGRIMLTPVYTKKVKGTNNFDIVLLNEFRGDILSYKRLLGKDIIVTKFNDRYEYIINNKVINTRMEYEEVLLSKISAISIFVNTSYLDPCHNKLAFKDSDNNEIETYFGSSKFTYENTMYVKDDETLISITFNEVKFKDNSKIVPLTNDWNVMPNSSFTMDGFLFQTALGKSFVYLPVPSKNQLICIKVETLNEYRIVNGKYSKNVCMLIGRKNSVYHKIILRFNHDFTTFDIRVIEDVDINSINFAVLDNGICASMEENNTMELFRNIPNDKDLKSITDPEINQSMRLHTDGVRILFTQQNKLCSIKMRKK